MAQRSTERRTGGERRVRRVSFHLPERRSGFDQRRCRTSGLRCYYERGLRDFRSNRSAFLLVLATIVVFNYVDLLLTVRALDLGAIEANPVMARLFEADLVLAAVVKLGIGGAAVLLLLAMRRFRRVLEASLVLVVGFSVLMGYHAVLALSLA
jgi:hypothetical protein